jgi:hypothetical protein
VTVARIDDIGEGCSRRKHLDRDRRRVGSACALPPYSRTPVAVTASKSVGSLIVSTCHFSVS